MSSLEKPPISHSASNTIIGNASCDGGHSTRAKRLSTASVDTTASTEARHGRSEAEKHALRSSASSANIFAFQDAVSGQDDEDGQTVPRASPAAASSQGWTASPKQLQAANSGARTARKQKTKDLYAEMQAAEHYGMDDAEVDASHSKRSHFGGVKKFDLGNVVHSLEYLRKYVVKGVDEEDEMANSAEISNTYGQRRVISAKQNLREAEADADAWLATLIGEETLIFLEREARQQEEVARWARFDAFFGLLVGANGVLLALTTDGVLDENASWMVFVQVGFFVAFAFEFAVRLRYQVRRSEASVSALESWGGSCCQSTCRRISECPCLARLLSDSWLLFDLAILVVMGLDISFILIDVAAEQTGSKSPLTAAITLLRIFRLLRMVRLIRLLKLLKELWLLVNGMLDSIQVLFWLLIALAIVVFIAALFFYELVGKDSSGDPEQWRRWGSVPRSMITLLQVATYDGWGDVVRRLLLGPPERNKAGMPLLIFFIIPFMAVTSLGILNLIIGVMLTSAMQLASHNEQYENHMKMLNERTALLELRREALRRCCQERGLPPYAVRSDEAPITRSMVLRWLHEEAEQLGEPAAAQTIKVKILRAKGLRNADMWGLSDPYCTVEIDGIPESTLRTEVIQHTLNPVWEEEFTFYDYDPRRALVFKIWDEDTHEDDFLGFARLTSERFMVPFTGSDSVLVLPLVNAGLGIKASLTISVDVQGADFFEKAILGKSYRCAVAKQVKKDPTSSTSGWVSQICSDIEASATLMITSASQSVAKCLSEEPSVHGMPKNPSRIARVLHDAGITEENVKQIFEEVDSVMQHTDRMHHAHERSISVAGFVTACMWLKSHVMPLDMLQVLCGLHSINDRLTFVDKYLSTALHEVQRVNYRLEPVMQRFHLDPRILHHEHHARTTNEEGRTMGRSPSKDSLGSFSSEAHQEEVLARHSALHRPADNFEAGEVECFAEAKERIEIQDRVWTKFDVMFSLVAIANVITIGVHASLQHTGLVESEDASLDADEPSSSLLHNPWRNSGLDLFWLSLDSMFLFLFFTEFCLRMTLYYQMDVEMSTHVINGFIPYSAVKMDLSRLYAIIRSIPARLRKDPFLGLDLFILILASFDLWILFLLLGGDVRMPVSILKGIRMLRLVRLVRLFYVVRPIHQMVMGVMNSFVLLIWALVVLMVVVYLAAIFIIEMIGMSDFAHEDVVQQYWGTLPKALLTMLCIATYEEWVQRIRELDQYFPGLWVFFIVFVVFTSLGIINLAVGIMVQAAFGIVTAEKEERHLEELARTKRELGKAQVEVCLSMRAAQKKKQASLLMKSQSKVGKAVGSLFGQGPQAGESRARKKAARWADPTTSVTSGKSGARSGAPGTASRTSREGDDETSIACSDLEDIQAALDQDDLFEEMQRLDERKSLSSADASNAELSITVDELKGLMEDVKIHHLLSKIGIRHDQVLAVFYKLDSGDGTVPADEFVGGLLRMKEKVQGVDVAAAKSWARRIVSEGEIFHRDAAEFKDCLVRCVESVRGITIMDDGDSHHMRNLLNLREQTHSGIQVLDMKRKHLATANTVLRDRAKRLRARINDRRLLLRRMGPARLCDRLPETDENHLQPPQASMFRATTMTAVASARLHKAIGTPIPTPRTPAGSPRTLPERGAKAARVGEVSGSRAPEPGNLYAHLTEAPAGAD